jgi:hypothetical protein
MNRKEKRSSPTHSASHSFLVPTLYAESKFENPFIMEEKR